MKAYRIVRLERLLIGSFLSVHLAGTASAQFSVGQGQVDAARDMIVLAVQQGISSLPPTSGQSLSYEFDPELSTFVASEYLGPTSFRSPETIGKGRWSLRVAYSYFELKDSFGPLDYLLTFDKTTDITGEPEYLVGVTAFGTETKATVNLANFAFDYGITNRLEFIFNVPISVVKARLSFRSPVTVGTDGSPTLNAGAVVGIYPSNTVTDSELAVLEGAFDDATSPSCDPETGSCITYRKDSANSLGFDFNNDASAGVGRISVGAKYLIYAGEYANLAGSLEFFNPSPSEDDYAGSDSPAILPRLIIQLPGRFRPDDYFQLHADIGYDYDFDTSQLRRLVWNAGVSVPFGRWATIDFGVGGAEFEQGIRWTPKEVSTGRPITVPGLGLENATPTLTALEHTRLGTSFVDFLGGFKVRITDQFVLSGSATTPLNNDGFRAAAVGSIAVEYYY